MFKIFFDTLVRPRDIVHHVDEKPKRKFVGFLILLILILVIPTFIMQIFSFTFTNQETEKIVTTLKKEEPIPYQIKDGKLIYTGNGDPVVRSVKLDKDIVELATLPVYLVFSLNGENYQVNDTTAFVVVFGEENLKIITRIATSNQGAVAVSSGKKGEKTIVTLSYKNLDVNFNYQEVSDNRYFMGIYHMGNHVYQKVKWGIIATNALFSISVNVASFVMSMIFTVALIGLLYRFMGIPFKKILKITILCSTPYVLFYLIAFLYQMNTIAILGEILSLIYTYYTMKRYSLKKIIDNHGGNRNEL